MNRITLKVLTKEQLNFIANGCGPKFWDWLVPDAIFESACILHDLAYWVGGTETSRKIADKKFLADMLKIASKQNSWVWWWKAYAQLAYHVVRILGSRAFHYGAPRGLEELKEEMNDA